MLAAFLNQRNDESDLGYMYYPMIKYTRVCEGRTRLPIGYRIRLNQIHVYSFSIQYLNKVVIVISVFLGFGSSILSVP